MFKNTISILSVIVFLVVGLLCGGIVGRCTASGKNKATINQLEEQIRQLEDSNSTARERVTELTESESRLRDRITEQGEIINRLENGTGQLRETNQGIAADLEELEKLLLEILGD